MKLLYTTTLFLALFSSNYSTAWTGLSTENTGIPSISDKDSKTTSNSYKVTKGSELADSEFRAAFEAINWDGYRFESKPSVLNFDNGITIELLSAQNLEKLNIDFDSNKIISDAYYVERTSVFHLSSTGQVIEKMRSSGKK